MMHSLTHFKQLWVHGVQKQGELNFSLNVFSVVFFLNQRTKFNSSTS